MNPSKLRLIPVFILVTVLILAPLNLFLQTKVATAAINQQINYQGKLTNSSGDAVADSTYSIVFSLYTTATGGSNIWTETQSVTATSGLFSVMLGSVTSLSTVNFNQTLYLGVNVASDGEMTPRKILGAVPASFESLNSDKLDGLTASDFLYATTTNATATITTLNVTGLNVANSTTTNATSTYLNVSNTASTSALIVSGNASLQTITSGIWNGTAIGATYGGTGLSSVSANQILIGNTAGTGWTQVATSSLGLLTTDVAEGSNLYYLDSRVNSYIHASTTVAKAYSDNTFTGSNIFNGALTISTLNGPLQANGGVVSATTSIGVIYGGTGLTTAPAYGEVLLGNSSGGYTLTATSSLGTGMVTSGTTGYLPYYASSGTTLTATSSLYLDTAGRLFVGGGEQTSIRTIVSARTGARGDLYLRDLSSGFSTGDTYTDGSYLASEDGVFSVAGQSSTGTGVAATLTVNHASSDGKVGIASTSPYAKLSVTNTGSAPSFIVEDVADDTSPFVINNAGLVGIGTASPTDSLTIAGSTGGFTLSETDGTNKAVVLVPQTTHGELDVYVSGSVINAHIDGSGDTYFASNNGDVGIASSTPWGKLSVTNTGTDPSFVVEDSTSPDSTPFIIDASGSVGIGTASPTSALEVVGNIEVQDDGFIGVSGGVGLTFDNTSTSNITISAGSQLTEGSWTIDQNGIFNATAGNATNPGFRFLSDTNNGMFLSTTDTLGFSTAGTERVTIDASGDVGIGTTTPWGKLSVTNTGTDPSFVVEDDTSPDSTPFIVSASGLVGIGTASPGNTLDVITTSTGQGMTINGDITNGRSPVISLTDDTNTAVIGLATVGGHHITSIGAGDAFFKTTTADKLHLATNNLIRLTVSSAGLVGIGTDSPAEQLDVYENSASEASIGLGNTEGGGTLNMDNTQLTLVNSATDGSIWLQANGAGVVYLNRFGGSGGVQIGDGTTNVVAQVSSAGILQIDSDLRVDGGDIGLTADTDLIQLASGAVTINGSLTLGTDLALASGGTGATLTDPNADRIMFWDDSAGAVTWLTAGSGLSISGTTITATGSGTPGGSSGQVQYNSSSSFGAEAAFFYDATNDILGVASSSAYQSGGIKTPSINSYVIGSTASAVTYISSGGSLLGAGSTGSNTFISVGGDSTAIGGASGGAAGNVYLAVGGSENGGAGVDGNDGDVIIGNVNGSKTTADLILYGDMTIDRGSDSTLIDFKSAGTSEGSISVSGTTVSYNAFTGSHYAWTNKKISRGTLVKMTGDNLNNNNDHEIVYGIEESTEANDPTVLGSYLSVLDKETHADTHLVMAVGNGYVWAVDNGEDLQRGDYLISSDTRGHAMKDLGNYDKSYVIARVAEDINWEEVTDMVDGKKHTLVSVFFENFISRGTNLSTLVAGGDIQATDPLVFDMENGEIKVFSTFDFQGQSIKNIASITSFTGTWSISEEGVLVADEIQANKVTVKNNLTAQKGLTTQDAVTGEYYCIYISNGSLTSDLGKCEDLNLAPPDTNGDNTGGGSTDGATGTTTDETSGGGGGEDGGGETPPPAEEVEPTPTPVEPEPTVVGPTPEPALEPEVVVEEPVVEVAPEPVTEEPSVGEAGNS